MCERAFFFLVQYHRKSNSTSINRNVLAMKYEYAIFKVRNCNLHLVKLVTLANNKMRDICIKQIHK